ncbi:MAG: response regulator [Pirellulales bacterium]|nr:response regulator [Pirellulales bacterium]
MRILVVDDDDVVTEIVGDVLARFGHHVTTARSGREALELMRSGTYRLVILDWEMEEMSGIELCRHIRQRYSCSYVYIIMLTVRRGTENIVEGLNAGADDFISKPFEPQELCVRIRAGERILALDSRELTIFSLAKLAESRDQETGAHLERIREYCRIIAGHLSRQEKFRAQVDSEFVQLIYMTSPLHDIGKVGIPDRILLKPSALTWEEFEIMKQHAVIGSKTLDAAVDVHPEAKFLCMARDIARSHHEWFDGSGYPDGLAGESIPLCGRIVGLADVYDALTTKRVYKKAYSHDVARDIILEETGTHFDPDIVRAFIENENLFVKIREQFLAREEFEALSLLQSQAKFIPELLTAPEFFPERMIPAGAMGGKS